jgi:hypothetical protein
MCHHRYSSVPTSTGAGTPDGNYSTSRPIAVRGIEGPAGVSLPGDGKRARDGPTGTRATDRTGTLGPGVTAVRDSDRVEGRNNDDGPSPHSSKRRAW